MADLLRVEEAAAALGVSASTLRTLIAKGVLSTVKPSPGALRIPASEIARLLQAERRLATAE